MRIRSTKGALFWPSTCTTLPMMKSKRVLVLDDSSFMRQILRRVLSTLGVEILEAEHVKDAVNILTKSAIDLLVTDWNMMGMSGVEFTRILRHLPDFSDLPILMLSNQDGIAHRQEAKKAGVDLMVSKSESFDKLRRNLQSLLGRGPTEDGVATRPADPDSRCALLLGLGARPRSDLGARLEGFGYWTLSARDTWDALEAIQGTPQVRLLILEGSAEYLDYRGFIQELEQNQEFSHIRIVAAMTRPGASEAPRIPPAGVHACLPHDCSPAELRATLTHLGLDLRE
jgi:CheY-like chemotaxis protein